MRVRLGRFAATVTLAVTMAGGGILTLPVAPVAAFTGHHCTKSTCQDFTSSYAGSHYYYRRCDSAWKSLSTTYLQGFTSSSALLARYPNRVLHKRC